jgi:hypothetical protein
MVRFLARDEAMGFAFCFADGFGGTTSVAAFSKPRDSNSALFFAMLRSLSCSL